MASEVPESSSSPSTGGARNPLLSSCSLAEGDPHVLSKKPYNVDTRLTCSRAAELARLRRKFFEAMRKTNADLAELKAQNAEMDRYLKRLRRETQDMIIRVEILKHDVTMESVIRQFEERGMHIFLLKQLDCESMTMTMIGTKTGTACNASKNNGT
ncbi:MAG: hypothetical protein MMC23_006387 [Stictis urceolatum]|nr:hypothetical protein [Stictis urceolata]